MVRILVTKDSGLGKREWNELMTKLKLNNKTIK